MTMPFNKHQAPLYEALAAHARVQAHAFHVPGHKQRAAWGGAEAEAYYGTLLPLDLTELPSTDDLHHPQGPLAVAQELAAHCYGAEETRYLVGGSTAGNLAMVIGTCRPGELLLVQRNVHKSIIHGLMLAGARAVLLPPDIDPISGLATIPSAVLVQQALERYPDAKGILLTTPNYYGVSAQIEPIVKLAHEWDIPVLVDEAHGPHFGFHPALPSSALQAGADIVVHSAHKMLSAMTMGAMIHMQGALADRESIRQALRMLQSSSPSFPIMASLDLARRQLHVEGAAAFTPALEAAAVVIDQLADTPFQALGYGHTRHRDLFYDPLKIVLFDETGGWSGFALRDELGRRGCVAEMADIRYVVLALGTGSTRADGEALGAAIRQMADDGHSGSQCMMSVAEVAATTAVAVPEPVTFRRSSGRQRTVRLEDSAGLRAGEWVIPYPPGIPVLFPGELITPDRISELMQWRHAGAQIQGSADPTLHWIQVEEA